MNPFELTKNPDGGGITVRVKNDFVVLTREEEKRITERITEILAENEKLRKYAKITADNLYGSGCDCCPYKDDHEACDLGIMPNGECRPYRELRELGIEVADA